MSKTTVGVLGGTGLYELEGLTDLRRVSVDTPFGPPSSAITTGTMGDVKLLFIARHGEGHVYSPSQVNYRANIYALKSLGAEWCLSMSAVGSLKDEIAPGHVVVPDQFIDRTKGRVGSFFGEGICAHIPFATPMCPVLRQELARAASDVAGRRETVSHDGGIYLCMEGPAFSTRAESHLYRSWHASVIGMTGLPEAKLVREAEMSYAMLALVTDYDCWRSESDDVDIAEIMRIVNENVALAQEVVREVIKGLAEKEPSTLAREALSTAIITKPERIPVQVKEDLRPIIGKYVD